MIVYVDDDNNEIMPAEKIPQLDNTIKIGDKTFRVKWIETDPENNTRVNITHTCTK